MKINYFIFTDESITDIRIHIREEFLFHHFRESEPKPHRQLLSFIYNEVV